ncbi:DUF4382 domain-containing protein [Candidatus Woesearchaeota archaeon]|nr:DUF4382 domain-containing protein [Candidatus Woesearchaeota archaeon]
MKAESARYMGIMVLFLGIVFLIGCEFDQPGMVQDNRAGDGPIGDSGSGTTDTSDNKGTVIFAVTDAAADMGTVTSVQITVDKVQVHTTTGNWITASSEPKTFDLLKLKEEGKLELLADADLDAGKYNEIRMEVSNAVVVDSEGSHEAKLPSGELKLNGVINVEEGRTSTASFDFIADESLHVTGKGTYVFAPVIKLETKEFTEVMIGQDNSVSIEGGRLITRLEAGMDETGKVGAGVKIPAKAELNIENGLVRVKGKFYSETEVSGGSALGGKGRIVVGITDKAASMESVTSIKVTVDSVQAHSAAKGWVTVSSQPKTFDLLKLDAEGKTELFADTSISTGTYQQLRLAISKAVVVDAEGEHDAKLPSGDIKIVGTLKIDEESTSTALFDFQADGSLHVAGNGKFILAPVIQLETREDAEVAAKQSGGISITGGSVKTKIEVGMDEEGNVGEGIKIPANVDLEIEGGMVKIKSRTGVSVGV